ncbi:type II toxin-antitoxin system VapC family toxin [Mucilaginibacter psychrotolerans]|uniref:PIN domain-containing protein n=1 Tax=Mucilaginibacter psychrotolerans TaxID=1524096 RepID=A0A4Y8SQ85_9SPHI|nr:PIN domain-containing protein [Mucilaginibacter psychrotolerans]TFF40780.1 PIN domain-containing protein [Mucilaginibacter psychrotolerans]
MAYKIFLDANVLLDYILKREHQEDAKAIIEMVQDGYVEGFITSSVLHIIGYWIAKAYGIEKTKTLLLNLLTNVKVIDITHEVALIAVHSKIDDIEDALQYYTAIHHKLDYFISRDKQLKKDGIPTLQVYTPQEFINRSL